MRGRHKTSRRPGVDFLRPYRIWLYPLPNFIALVGWIFVFATSGTKVILFGLATLLTGIFIFLAWPRFGRRGRPNQDSSGRQPRKIHQ